MGSGLCRVRLTESLRTAEQSLSSTSKGSSRVAQGVSTVYTRASRPTEKLGAEVSSLELPGPAQCTGAYRINDMEAATC